MWNVGVAGSAGSEGASVVCWGFRRVRGLRLQILRLGHIVKIVDDEFLVRGNVRLSLLRFRRLAVVQGVLRELGLHLGRRNVGRGAFFRGGEEFFLGHINVPGVSIDRRDLVVLCLQERLRFVGELCRDGVGAGAFSVSEVLSSSHIFWDQQPRRVVEACRIETRSDDGHTKVLPSWGPCRIPR